MSSFRPGKKIPNLTIVTLINQNDCISKQIEDQIEHIDRLYYKQKKN